MKRAALFSSLVCSLLIPAVAQGRPLGDHDGTWTVVPSESFLGYRVRERLAALPAPSDAVGRTSAIVGTAVISNDQIISTVVSSDLRTLKSDKEPRDHAVIWRLGRLPQARFTLLEPILLPQISDDQAFPTSARARLMIHGVARTVTFPLQMRWTVDRLQVIGTLRVKISDFKIQSVRVGPVVSVSDSAKIEVSLSFQRQ